MHVFDVDFEGGDANTPVARATKHFSESDNPPEVQSGEVLIKHQAGGSDHHKADGSKVYTHKDGGSTTWDKDGAYTVKHKDGGTINVDKDGHVAIKTKDKNFKLETGKGSQTISGQNCELA